MGSLMMSPLMLVPPPFVQPHPLSFPAEGGERHLVNTNFFVTAHCVVVWVCDCVVSRFYPLYSWQDMLLSFAEMELWNGWVNAAHA